MPVNQGPPFPRIANCYANGLHAYTSLEHLHTLAKQDLLLGGINLRDNPTDKERAQYAWNLAKVRELNPHIIMLDYLAMCYVWTRFEDFPKDGWLRQPDGRIIAGWPGSNMVNLTKPSVLNWFVETAVASVREKGFDGLFLDCMGPRFDHWACYPDTGESYTVDIDEDGVAEPDDELNRVWRQQKETLASRIRERLGPEVPIVANGTGSWGKPYFNGAMFEDYIDRVYEGKERWENYLKQYLSWRPIHYNPLVMVCTTSSGVEPPFEAIRERGAQLKAICEEGRNKLQRMRFGLTTVLMGDGYHAFDLHTRLRGQLWWYPEYDAPLGYPKGEAQQQQTGLWQRDYDGGTVVVNPTDAPQTVTFATRRRDVSSDTVATSFDIPSQDGRILVR